MSVPILSAGASVGAVAAAAAPASAPPGSVEAFSQSMARHSAVDVAEAQSAAGQQAAGASDAAAPVHAGTAADAQSRARQALELTGPKEHGDAIIDGLQRLRGVFDARENMVNRLMSSSAADTRTMMAMQMEVANFTLLVDVASKLTGKSTQALDTLMKGQ